MTEQSEWAIVRVSGLTQNVINLYESGWFDEENEPLSYRKYKLKSLYTKNLSVGIYPQTTLFRKGLLGNQDLDLFRRCLT